MVRTLVPRARRIRLALICVAVPAIVAAGCGDDASKAGSSGSGSDAGGQTNSSPCHTDAKPETEPAVKDGADVEAVVAKRTKPEVVVPKKAATELLSTDIIEGTGEPIGEGADVTVQYVGVSQSDCKEFDSSWERGEPASFNLAGVIEGWSTGLVGMKPGGRRHLVIPAELAYGDDASGGQPAGTLVFVVDLISSAAPLAADPAALSAAESRGKPAVAVPNPLPTELTSTDDVVGTGTEVKDGMQVVAHYVGVTADGQEFDSSWSRNEPVTFGLDEVIPGWTKGLPGMKVGGRRTLVIPADLAYGTDASSGRPTGTLIFVIDLVGAG